MTKRTTKDWKALVEAQAASGQTATAFCREHGINAKYFSTRRRALIEAPLQGKSKFSPVTLPAMQGGSELRVECAGGVVLRLPSSVEPLWLAKLLRALQD